jgi:cellulose synthase/poly-beta-1,6-N-acetylglucosamine synthase-like glycosyltransferase
MSEEINNTIFRFRSCEIGMSAALIGSGMAFQYDLFRDTMANIKAVGGFDRETGIDLLYQGKHFHYLPETFVFDEKVQNTNDFSRQRRRWLSAQWQYCTVFAVLFLKQLHPVIGIFAIKVSATVHTPACYLLGFTFLLAFSFHFTHLF